MYFRTKSIDVSDVPIFTRSVHDQCYVIMKNDEYKPMRNVTAIILSDNAVEPELEKVAIVCYSYKELMEYLQAPISELTIKYNVVGFKGLRKMTLHTLLKGSSFSSTNRTLDYCKIDLSQGATSTKACKVKSCLNPRYSKEYLTKDNLYKLGNFVPECEDLASLNYVSGVYIAKPIGRASSGEGISVISSQEQLCQAKRIIYSRWNQGIACRYINNPLLFEGRKFHLRVYLFVSTVGVFSLFDEAKIITAQLPYIKGDYDNKEIHDTHLRSTDKNYFFTKDFPYDRHHVWDQVKVITDAIIKVPFAGYSEAVKSYDILGIDILVDDTLKCWLLEVNFSPSMHPVTYNDYSEFEKQFLSWEFSLVKQLL